MIRLAVFFAICIFTSAILFVEYLSASTLHDKYVSDLTFRFYPYSDGLTQSTIHHTTKDRAGFVYIITRERERVYTFDGYNFEPFNYHPTEAENTPANTVWTTIQSINGNYWIGTGTIHEDLYVYNSKQ